MYEELCESLLRIIPDMSWSDEAVCALQQAVELIRKLDQETPENTNL